MGYRHSKEEILEGAISFAFAEGLSRLTFGALGRHLGISDRIIVYYFPTKDALVGEVLGAIGLRLQSTLGSVVGSSLPHHKALVEAVWPVVARKKSDPVFALFFEASGLAAAGVEPYRSMAAALVNGWIGWAEQLIGGSPEHRKVEAAAAIAILDGLLLMRQLAGPDAADRAVSGIVSNGSGSRPRRK